MKEKNRTELERKKESIALHCEVTFIKRLHVVRCVWSLETPDSPILRGVGQGNSFRKAHTDTRDVSCRQKEDDSKKVLSSALLAGWRMQ